MRISSFEPYAIYWRLYGGLHHLVRSVYLWSAVGATLVCSPYWLAVDVKENVRPATDTALSMVPSLMSFTLGGMAILLALSGGKFLDAIREDGSETSMFLKVVALFFHFLAVETMCLIFAFLSKAYTGNNWLAAAMFFLLVYGVMSALSIAAMLINVARIYNLTGSGDADD